MSGKRPTVEVSSGAEGWYRGKPVQVQAVVGADKLLVFEQGSSDPHLVRIDELIVQKQDISGFETLMIPW